MLVSPQFINCEKQIVVIVGPAGFGYHPRQGTYDQIISLNWAKGNHGLELLYSTNVLVSRKEIFHCFYCFHGLYTFGNWPDFTKRC
jgi:hypothetical protein